METKTRFIDLVNKDSVSGVHEKIRKLKRYKRYYIIKNKILVRYYRIKRRIIGK